MVCSIVILCTSKSQWVICNLNFLTIREVMTCNSQCHDTCWRYIDCICDCMSCWSRKTMTSNVYLKCTCGSIICSWLRLVINCWWFTNINCDCIISLSKTVLKSRNKCMNILISNSTYANINCKCIICLRFYS